MASHLARDALYHTINLIQAYRNRGQATLLQMYMHPHLPAMTDKTPQPVSPGRVVDKLVVDKRADKLV